MKKNRLIAAVAAAALVISGLAGCGSSASTESAQTVPAGTETESSVQKSSEAVNKTGYPIMNEDYTFKIVYAVGSTDKIGGWENKDFVKKIEEDTELKIQWVGIPEASYNDQVAIMIAAGDLPDAFIGQIPNFAQFLDSFVKMNDMIDDYAPSLKEFFDKYPNIKLAGMFPDGSVYGLPEVQLDGYVAGKSLAINKKWLDAVGMEMPETADELFDVLMAFKTQDPNGNGQADEIPFAFYKDRKFDILKSAFGFAGYDEKDYKYPYLQVEDGKVDFYPVSENYHAYLQYLNKLYSNGLIDPNGFIQEEVDMIAKGTNDQIGVFPNYSYDDITVGDYAGDYTYLLPLKDSNGERHYQPSAWSGTVIVNQFAITNNCPYPEAMLRLYDYINSSFDNRLLFGWGPKDMAWVDNGDGTISKKADPVLEGYNSYAEVRHTLSMGIKGIFLWTEEDNAKFAVTSDREIKYMERQEPYMDCAVKEFLPEGQDYPENTQEINVLLTELRTYMDNFMAESVMNGIDDAKWQKHLEDCRKFSYERYTELNQEYYDRMMKLAEE